MKLAPAGVQFGPQLQRTGLSAVLAVTTLT
jgi:hypothetical protein